MSTWAEKVLAEHVAGNDRIRDAAQAAIASNAEPLSDWRGCIGDALRELDQIATHDGAHPDDVDHARAAVSLLAGVFLTSDQIESTYLGER